MAPNLHTLRVKAKAKASNPIHSSLGTAKPQDQDLDLICHPRHSTATILLVDSHRTDIILTTDQPPRARLECHHLDHHLEVWDLAVLQEVR